MAFELSDLTNLGQQISGYYTAAQNAGNVNGIAGAQQQALNGQYSSLQNQVANSTAQYATDRANLDKTNLGLTGQMQGIASQLQGLSDPNSAYMQQSRQAIERKDAAAGRNSQWGDREVQLAALLSEQANKYAPGLQSQYTNMANSIADNEAKLNRQYQDSLNGYNQAYLGLIGAGNGAAATANGAQQQANNQRANAAAGAAKPLLNGLSAMFGGSGGDGGGITGFMANSGLGGITGYGSSLGNLYGGEGNLSGAGIGQYGSFDGFGGSTQLGGFGSGAYGMSGLTNGGGLLSDFGGGGGGGYSLGGPSLLSGYGSGSSLLGSNWD